MPDTIVIPHAFLDEEDDFRVLQESDERLLLQFPDIVRLRLLVEMAFGYGPGAASPVWTDISSYCRAADWRRGRQNELSQMQAGVGGLTIADANSHFDPRNTASPFYPNVRPGTPVRATLSYTEEVDGVETTRATWPLFKMYTERQPRTLRVADRYTERHFDLIDGFALLANARLSGFNYPIQNSDQRVSAVLDSIGWPAAARDIRPGTSILHAKQFAGDDATSAQEHLTRVGDSENGFLYVDGGGNVIFIGRHELIQNGAITTSQATFRDAFGSSGFPYVDLEPSFDIDQVVNKFVGTREGGSPQTAEDAASQAQYFLRVQQFDSEVLYDAEVRNQAQWKLSQFAQPLDRIESIVTMPTVDITNVPQVTATLDRDVGDRVTVLETPPGFAGEQSKDYVIQSVACSMNASESISASLTVKFQLWPAVNVSYWTVGDPVLGLIGVSTKAGY